MGKWQIAIVLALGAPMFIGCDPSNKEWDAFGVKWRAASPDERRAMSDMKRIGAEFANASRRRVRRVFGKADFTGIENGTDIMRYNLGVAPELDGQQVLEFHFENDKVYALFGYDASGQQN